MTTQSENISKMNSESQSIVLPEKELHDSISLVNDLNNNGALSVEQSMIESIEMESHSTNPGQDQNHIEFSNEHLFEDKEEFKISENNSNLYYNLSSTQSYTQDNPKSQIPLSIEKNSGSQVQIIINKEDTIDPINNSFSEHSLEKSSVTQSNNIDPKFTISTSQSQYSNQYTRFNEPKMNLQEQSQNNNIIPNHYSNPISFTAFNVPIDTPPNQPQNLNQINEHNSTPPTTQYFPNSNNNLIRTHSSSSHGIAFSPQSSTPKNTIYPIQLNTGIQNITVANNTPSTPPFQPPPINRPQFISPPRSSLFPPPFSPIRGIGSNGLVFNSPATKTSSSSSNFTTNPYFSPITRLPNYNTMVQPKPYSEMYNMNSNINSYPTPNILQNNSNSETISQVHPLPYPLNSNNHFIDSPETYLFNRNQPSLYSLSENAKGRDQLQGYNPRAQQNIDKELESIHSYQYTRNNNQTTQNNNIYKSEESPTNLKATSQQNNNTPNAISNQFSSSPSSTIQMDPSVPYSGPRLRSNSTNFEIIQETVHPSYDHNNISPQMTTSTQYNYISNTPNRLEGSNDPISMRTIPPTISTFTTPSSISSSIRTDNRYLISGQPFSSISPLQQPYNYTLSTPQRTTPSMNNTILPNLFSPIEKTWFVDGSHTAKATINNNTNKYPTPNSFVPFNMNLYPQPNNMIENTNGSNRNSIPTYSMRKFQTNINPSYQQESQSYSNHEGSPPYMNSPPLSRSHIQQFYFAHEHDKFSDLNTPPSESKPALESSYHVTLSDRSSFYSKTSSMNQKKESQSINKDSHTSSIIDKIQNMNINHSNINTQIQEANHHPIAEDKYSDTDTYDFNDSEQSSSSSLLDNISSLTSPKKNMVPFMEKEYFISGSENKNDDSSRYSLSSKTNDSQSQSSTYNNYIHSKDHHQSTFNIPTLNIDQVGFHIDSIGQKDSQNQNDTLSHHSSTKKNSFKIPSIETDVSIILPSAVQQLLNVDYYTETTTVYSSFIQRYLKVLKMYFNITDDFSDIYVNEDQYDDDDIQTIYDICFHLFFLIKTKIYHFYQSLIKQSQSIIKIDTLLQYPFINDDVNLQSSYLMQAFFLNPPQINDFHKSITKYLPSEFGEQNDAFKLDFFKSYTIKSFYQ